MKISLRLLSLYSIFIILVLVYKFSFSNNDWIKKAGGDKDGQIQFIARRTIDVSVGKLQKQTNHDYIAAMKKEPNFILDKSTNVQVLKNIGATFNSTMDDINTYKFGLTLGAKTLSLFLNPYSIFGPDSFANPRGLPRNLSNLDEAHFPHLVRVNSAIVGKVVVLQSSIAGLADVQHSATGWVHVVYLHRVRFLFSRIN